MVDKTPNTTSGLPYHFSLFPELWSIWGPFYDCSLGLTE